MGKFVVVLLTLSLLLPLPVFAADPAELMQKIDALSQELDRLKQEMHDMQKKEEAKEKRIETVEQKAAEAAPAKAPSIEIGGDYRFRADWLEGKSHDALVFGPSGPAPVPGTRILNNTLFLNRFGLNMKADAIEDIEVKARLVMYKVWGMESANTVTGQNAFFADKQSIFDANIAHVPQDNTLRVDYAYATWTDMFGQPLWFSVGRRPSTGGIPSNVRQNLTKSGTAGTPACLVDWAFDGATLGYAPDIPALPGAYAKVCGGKGFESGFKTGTGSGTANSLKDTWMIGVNVVPYDTQLLHLEVQWNRAIDFFAFPENFTMPLPGGFSASNKNLGSMDQYGVIAMSTLPDVGPGDLNLFAAGSASRSHPNSKALFSEFPGFPVYGMLWDSGTPRHGKTGYLVHAGGRYDFKPTLTKIGVEYNHGSKNWLLFGPASDDMWTTKLGTRGNVYEAYLIQELNKKPIANRGKAFFRLGYQYYDFQYTGSQNWVGAPYKISTLTRGSMPPQFFVPVQHAQDIYLTFDVLF